MDTFPPLPVEIVRMIMEVSAESTPVTGATLTRLCREIRRWIIPIFYRTIVVSSTPQVSILCRTLQRQDFASHIRNLAMTCVHSVLSMKYEHVAVLEKCVHLESLLLGCSPPYQSDAGPTISWPTPHQVILTRAHMMWVRHPMLQNVTHLSIRGFCLDGSFVNTCRYLTQLTHARFWFLPEDLRALWLEKLLSLYPRLHMVLATVRSSHLSHVTPFTLTGDPWITLAGNKDDRLFVGVTSWDLESDLTLLEPGDNVWVAARAMLNHWREWVKRHPVIGYCRPIKDGSEPKDSEDELELEI